MNYLSLHLSSLWAPMGSNYIQFIFIFPVPRIDFICGILLNKWMHGRHSSPPCIIRLPFSSLPPVQQTDSAMIAQAKSLTWCHVLLWLFLLLALFLSHFKHLLYVTLLTVPLSPLRCPWTSAESIKHRITSTRSLTNSWQVPEWIFKLLVMVNS